MAGINAKRSSFRVETSSKSSIPFVDTKTGTRVEALGDAVIHATSDGLQWRGMVAEIGHNRDWETNDLTVDGHYLSMNLGSTPLRFESRGSHGFQEVVMAPGSLWLNPDRQPFTHRVAEAAEYGAITLSPNSMERSLGGRVELRPRYGFQDEQLGYLFRAVLLELRGGGLNGAAFADAMRMAISLHLAAHYGTVLFEDAQQTGLTHQRLARVRDFIEAHLGDVIGIEEIAAVSDLSAHHFAREFKRSTGHTPFAYLMTRRLERARDVLSTGRLSIAAVALDLGFADQPHLTRLFRQRYGVTPGAFVRRCAGGSSLVQGRAGLVQDEHSRKP